MKKYFLKTSFLLKIVLVTLLVANTSSLGSAQDMAVSGSGLPEGPLPAPAPNFSQWVITVSDPQAKSKAGGTPEAANPSTHTIITTKTGQIIHEEIRSGTEVTVDEWHVGSILYIKSTGSTVWGEITRRSSNFEVFPASGFRNLDWIKKENYVGTVQCGGHSCLAFVQARPSKLDLSDANQLDSLDAYAFLDATSRLPVQVRANGLTYFYQFKDAPTEKLALPSDLAEQLQKGQEAEERLNQRMPRPY
jgi:hypothetical protein